jgi:DNA-binding LacI/PurR family transcriptional regulator
MKAMKEAGIRVPDDVSVIECDDLPRMGPVQNVINQGALN